MDINLKDDIRLVQNVRRNAYVEKQEYTVGAVLTTKSGRKYTGCNIEVEDMKNIYAEEVAFMKAISEGEKEFDYMVIMGGKKNQEPEKYLPNENCKKFINHFVNEEFKMYSVYEKNIEEYILSN